MGIKTIFRHILFSCEESEFCRRHEREEKSFSLAMRTITFEDGFREIEVDSVFYGTTVATSVVRGHKSYLKNFSHQSFFSIPNFFITLSQMYP